MKCVKEYPGDVLFRTETPGCVLYTPAVARLWRDYLDISSATDESV